MDWDESTLTGAERLQLAEQRRLNFKQDLANEAHQRAMERHRNFVSISPNSVSPWDKQATLGYASDRQREEAIREHERKMLADRGEIDLGIAEKKRLGMREQGMEAADAKGKWERDVERERGNTALSLEERKIAGQKNLAEIGLKQHELEWGRGGGRERIAEIEGKSRVGAADAQARASAEIQAQKNALEEQKRLAAAEKEKGRLKLQYDKLDQRDRASVDAAANRLASEKGISFEDARSQVMASREQAQPNAPEEGATKTLSSGRKVVFRNGKWQYAD